MLAGVSSPTVGKSLVGVAVLAAVVVVGLTVWPTVWSERNAAISGRHVTIRTHRLDGRMQYLGPTGWRPMARPVTTGSGFTPVACPDVTREEWRNNPFTQVICQEPK